MKWAVSLVFAYGHFNIPLGCERVQRGKEMRYILCSSMDHNKPNLFHTAKQQARYARLLGRAQFWDICQT